MRREKRRKVENARDGGKVEGNGATRGYKRTLSLEQN
jgi:hypothetical protein